MKSSPTALFGQGPRRLEAKLSGPLRIITAIALSVIIVSGLGAAAAYLAGLNVYYEADLATAVTLFSLFIVAGAGGTFALYLLLKRPASVTRDFLPPSSLVIFGLFVAVVAVGSLVLAVGRGQLVLFPPLHVLAVILPGLALLFLVARTVTSAARPAQLVELDGDSAPGPLASPQWRRVAASWFIGSYLAVPLAVIFELLLGVIIGVVVVAGSMPSGGLLPSLDSFLRASETALAGDSQAALSGPVFLGLLLILVVVAPLVEELVKSLGVLISRSYSSAAQAMLAGAAAGAGFAIVENIAYSTISMSAWGAVVVFRVATVLIHTFGSAIVGLGWYGLMQQKKTWKFFAAYGSAVTLHGLWNGATIGVFALGLSIGALEPSSLASTSALIILLLVAIVALLAVSIGGLVYIGRRVRTVV
jgi:RsiW-degrading membrane proteinase PrsW (M82 family)